ncbi:rCG45106 [Rattus norvegicus]|uniref:RCG45106 n=1 Tax=Rattus norvegicus TaxID=10116 RepID=A6KD21_RAT|nr:rCG45106 [Rattus norvegicus]
MESGFVLRSALQPSQTSNVQQSSCLSHLGATLLMFKDDKISCILIRACHFVIITKMCIAGSNTHLKDAFLLL